MLQIRQQPTLNSNKRTAQKRKREKRLTKQALFYIGFTFKQT